MDMLNEVEYLALHLCVCCSSQNLHADVLLQEDNKAETPAWLVFALIKNQVFLAMNSRTHVEVLTRQPRLAEA